MTLPRRALEFATKHHFPQWIQYALYCWACYEKSRRGARGARQFSYHGRSSL